MIKGEIREERIYDFQSMDAFLDFLHLIDKAAVTYTREIVVVDGEEQSQPEIRFNLSSSLEKYRLALTNSFSNSCDDIEASIDEIYNKLEKLNLLSRYIIEVDVLQSMLGKEGTQYRHIYFSFSNLSEGEFASDVMDESQFQEYYYWMDLFIQKARSFLHYLKHTVEITRQNEFPIPSRMLPNPNASSLENPLASFDFLLTKNGISILRYRFIPSQDDEYYYPDVSYDKLTEIKTIADRDPETGEWDERKVQFKDELFNWCFKEYNISKQFIDERILKAVNRAEITLFIEVLISRLKYLREITSKNKEAKKYVDLPGPIDALIRFLFEKYPSFCPSYKDDLVITSVLLPTSSPQLNAASVPAFPTPRNPGVFKWIKGEPIRLTTLLHAKLNNKFISDTPLEFFHRAFSGDVHDKPLGIKWIDKPSSGAHVNKVSLLYLFKRMNEVGLIDTTFEENDFTKKLEFVFADPGGNRLENWTLSKKSVQAAKKMTFAKREIESIILLLNS